MTFFCVFAEKLIVSLTFKGMLAVKIATKIGKMLKSGFFVNIFDLEMWKYNCNFVSKMT